MTDLPAFFARRGALAAAATSGIGGSRPAHISRKDNRFTLVDAVGTEHPVETFHLDMVIVGVNPKSSKVYYPGVYQDGNSGPPDCFSDNGTGPSAFAQNPQAKTCMLCPHNVWNTGPRGTGRACRDSKKLAVIVPGDPSGIVYEFQVPPGSFNDDGKSIGWKRFVSTVREAMVGNRSCDLFDIVTRVEFVSQGVLSFKPVKFVADDAELMDRFSTLSDDAVDLVTGINDVARDPQAPLEVQQKPIAPPAGNGAPLSITQQAVEKRHRATKAEMEQRRAAQQTNSRVTVGYDNAPPAPTRPVQTPQTTDMGDVPAFLQRAAAPAVGVSNPAQGHPAAPAFGIQSNPPPPPESLKQSLANAFPSPGVAKAFNLKTG